MHYYQRTVFTHQMIKDILQFIGIVVLILIAIFALFFLLDNIHLLSGTLGSYISVMHTSFNTMWDATKAFVSGTGLANEAATILGSGADKLRDVADGLAQENGVAATQEPANETQPTPAPTNEPISGQDPTVTQQPVEFVFSTAVPVA